MQESFLTFDSMPDSIAILDSKGIIIFTNDHWKQFGKENFAELQKIDNGSCYLKACLALRIDNDGTIAKQGIEKVLKRELKIFELEYPCHSPMEHRWFILRVVPLKGWNEYTLVTHINVTKLKKAKIEIGVRNNQLKQANKRIFLRSLKIAYDLQGPLNSVQSLISHAKRTEDGSISAKLFREIQNNVDELKEYAITILDLSSKKNKPKPIIFHEIIDALVKNIIEKVSLNTLDISYSSDQNNEFWMVQDDLETILTPIIFNAIQHINDANAESLLRINVLVNEKEAVISLKDNGIGISENSLNSVFKKEFQANSTDTALGLSLAKTTVEDLGGNISVSSELNKGTNFEVVIPNMRLE